MAIDNAEKRRSVAGISVGFGITPNASKDLEWRQQVGWSYSGIATGAGGGGTPVAVFMFHYMQQRTA